MPDMHRRPMTIPDRVRAVASVLLLLAGVPANAANLLEQFQVVTTGAPAYSEAFNLAQTGDYSLELTDQEFPAPLDYVDAAVVRGAALVGMQSGAGTAAFSAQSGNQTLYVVGAPAAAQGTGSFGVEITPDGGAPVVSSVGTLQMPSAVTATALQRDFTVNTPAQYTLTLSDRVFPVALDTVAATVVRLSDQTTVATLAAAGSVDFDADAGDYRVFIVADTTASVGLFSFELASTSGMTVFAETSVIDHGGAGSKLIQQSVTLAAGQSSLALTDFQFPGALEQFSARVVQGAEVVASLDAAGEIEFSATHIAHQLFVYAQAAAAPGSGSFGATLSDTSGTPFEAVDVVSIDAEDASSSAQRSFDIDTAGSYALTLTDF